MLHPGLKFRRPLAESTHMPRGGTVIRRRLVTFTVLLGVGAALLPTSGALASTHPPLTQPLTAGEAGSGPPMPPPPRLSTAQTESASGIKFNDVPAKLADQSSSAVNYFMPAIKYVAAANNWMRDYKVAKDGTYPFNPNKIETRELFARAVVRAFAPKVAVDPSIRFPDLPSDDPFYPFANVAVQKGWIKATKAGAFHPLSTVVMRGVHRALVLAVGLGHTAKDLDAIHTSSGYAFKTPAGFGTTLLGMRLGLRYNHGSPYEGVDVDPSTPMPRSEVAYSLYRATTLDSWVVPSLESQYGGITLPRLGPKVTQLVQWGIDFVGYPYYWGGEWDAKTPAGYPFGAQSRGGFDCSGLTWWVLKRTGNGWDNAPPRPYHGWPLPQRTSTDMASVGKVGWNHLVPGDVMFYDGNNDHVVDHVDTYIGNGFSIDSSSTPGGVTLMWVGDGWYHDHFVHGRRVIPTK
jgi:cell wall-associated NlpC family hydrolase